MSDLPQDLLYTKEHEWARITGTVARVGITLFAVEQLGDVTQVDLPEVGDSVELGAVFGAVESVKAVSDLYAPVSGTVKAINENLADIPELVNDSCYDKAWMVDIELSDPDSRDGLMSPSEYEALIQEQS